MKFPAELRLLEQPLIVLLREGDRGHNLSALPESEDPATGERLTLKLLAASTEPVGGDLGQQSLGAAVW